LAVCPLSRGAHWLVLNSDGHSPSRGAHWLVLTDFGQLRRGF
jgi:hypothetical protein